MPTTAKQNLKLYYISVFHTKILILKFKEIKKCQNIHFLKLNLKRSKDIYFL